MKIIAGLVLAVLLLLPAAILGQTTPVSTPGFTISTARPMTRAEYLTILGDSLDAMEVRLSTALGDTATAAVNAALADSLPFIEARLMVWLQDQVDTTAVGRLDAKVDSTLYLWGEAGDTTSPGHFYTLDAAGVWLRTGTAATEKAMGVAVDSVNKGAACRFQWRGLFTLARWIGLFPPGTQLVNDSTTAGEVSTLDTLRSNTKKMQVYGTSVDSASGKIVINIDPSVWVWED